MLKVIPRDYFDDAKGTLKLLWEEEWRGLGITQVGCEKYTELWIMLTLLRVLDGNTMRCTSLNHTFCCSSKSSRRVSSPHADCFQTPYRLSASSTMIIQCSGKVFQLAQHWDGVTLWIWKVYSNVH
jgi:hypothetical protein